MKEYLKNHSNIFKSVLLFILTTIMIGFSSNGIRIFFLNILQIGAVSFCLNFALFIVFRLDKENIPVVFLWSVIFFALTIGSF